MTPCSSDLAAVARLTPPCLQADHQPLLNDYCLLAAKCIIVSSPEEWQLTVSSQAMSN